MFAGERGSWPGTGTSRGHMGRGTLVELCQPAGRGSCFSAQTTAGVRKRACFGRDLLFLTAIPGRAGGCSSVPVVWCARECCGTKQERCALLSAHLTGVGDGPAACGSAFSLVSSSHQSVRVATIALLQVFVSGLRGTCGSWASRELKSGC